MPEPDQRIESLARLVENDFLDAVRDAGVAADEEVIDLLANGNLRCFVEKARAHMQTVLYGGIPLHDSKTEYALRELSDFITERISPCLHETRLRFRVHLLRELHRDAQLLRILWVPSYSPTNRIARYLPRQHSRDSEDIE
jgi:hypothetical protein